MKINTDEAKTQVGVDQPFHLITSADQLEIDQAELSVTSEIRVDGTISYTGRLYEISGMINLSAKRVCDRCLTLFEAPIEIPFEELFREEGIAPEEEDAVVFTGDEIDLTDIIREMVCLVGYTKSLCIEDCKGLCLKCGTNLNEQDCQCDRHIIDPRLAALQDFFLKKED